MKKFLASIIMTISLMTGFVVAADETNTQDKPKISELTGVESKKLVGNAVSSLNSIFSLPEVDEGFVGKLLVSALDNSVTVLNTLEKYEKGYSEEKKKLLDERFVAVSKKALIGSLSFSLPILYKYRSILKILLEESLGGSGFSYSSSLLYRFLKSDSEAVAKTFFEKNIITKHDIRSCCIDFAVLFGDLEYTMPSLFEKGRERMNTARPE